jgi:hypothetical protein
MYAGGLTGPFGPSRRACREWAPAVERAKGTLFAAAAAPPGESPVPQCKSCGEDADELITVKLDGRKQRICESCADQANVEQTIREDSEAVVQNMMGFRGRR